MTPKLDPEDQANLMLARPGVIEPVSGTGARVADAARQGWTFVRYELCDEAEMGRLLRLAWEGAWRAGGVVLQVLPTEIEGPRSGGVDGACRSTPSPEGSSPTCG